MCVVAIAWYARPDLPLVIAANRDEAYARPTLGLDFWQDHPAVLAGRDLEKGGTWLGLTRGGRCALVTNYRDFRRVRPVDAPSRGALVGDFLLGSVSPLAYVERIATHDAAYDGYNTIALELPAALGAWHGNVDGGTLAFRRGTIYGLSNAALDTPWPKVERLKASLADALQAGGVSTLEERLLAALADRTVAPDATLPDTGVGLELERALAPAFVHRAGYGTRCSSVITVDVKGHATFVERTFFEDERRTPETRRFALDLDARPGP